MMRESLAPNSKHAFIGWDGNNGLRYIIRTQTGGSNISLNGVKGVPSKLWLRLVRSGSTIFVFTSFDRLNWKRIAKSSLFMSPSCYVGLIVIGGGTNLSTGGFQDVVVKP
jgi:regulation of enolase protein 1 (concanavalin A-like superfamily)